MNMLTITVNTTGRTLKIKYFNYYNHTLLFSYGVLRCQCYISVKITDVQIQT